MPYLQPKTNNYFGFCPATGLPGTLVPSNYYFVSSSEALDINMGDVVMMTTKDTARIITGAFVVSSSAAILGVAASNLTAGAGSTGATLNANTSQFLLVWDAPGQQYVVCDTTSASAGVESAVFKNYAILATGAVGSTGPNSSLKRSVQAISGATATAAGAFHILGLHPIEGGVYSSGGAATAVTSSGVSKWIGVFISQVTMQSTTLSAMVNTTS